MGEHVEKGMGEEAPWPPSRSACRSRGRGRGVPLAGLADGGGAVSEHAEPV